MSAADDEFWELWGEWGQNSDGTPKPLTVERYLGPGQLGPKYAAPESWPGLPQMPKARLVKSSAGNEVLAGTAVAAPLSYRDSFPLHSRVTLASGLVASVLVVEDADTQGIFGFLVISVGEVSLR